MAALLAFASWGTSLIGANVWVVNAVLLGAVPVIVGVVAWCAWLAKRDT